MLQSIFVFLLKLFSILPAALGIYLIILSLLKKPLNNNKFRMIGIIFIFIAIFIFGLGLYLEYIAPDMESVLGFIYLL